MCKEADLHRNPTVVMIILSNVTYTGTAMEAYIHVGMVLTIKIMGAGVIKTVEIKIGILIAETNTCRHIELPLGL